MLLKWRWFLVWDSYFFFFWGSISCIRLKASSPFKLRAGSLSCPSLRELGKSFSVCCVPCFGLRFTSRGQYAVAFQACDLCIPPSLVKIGPGGVDHTRRTVSWYLVQAVDHHSPIGVPGEQSFSLLHGLLMINGVLTGETLCCDSKWQHLWYQQPPQTFDLEKGVCF